MKDLKETMDKLGSAFERAHPQPQQQGAGNESIRIRAGLGFRGRGNRWH
jgi:hypothetical protein